MKLFSDHSSNVMPSPTFNFSYSKLTSDGAPVIIVLGLERTGTTSVKVALEKLLKQPCYHLSEIRDKHPEHVIQWKNLFLKLKSNPSSAPSKNEIDGLVKGYRSSSGLPLSSLYHHLVKLYPEAKFILTTRDRKLWIQSVRETVLPRGGMKVPDVVGPLAEFLKSCFETNTLAIRHTLGDDLDLDDDIALMNAYDKRNAEIEATIPSDRLLLFRPGMGWDPLCKFLNLPIPDEGFPWVNTREQFYAEWQKLLEGKPTACSKQK
ncbi:unnamed protein product [Echinostoma caproni]|uniref:Sulfotransferase family protein n=1 Tax=Echinostoma caproni TaxID=27848 RepID=A0A183A642_9TREM|nr:unnamed protein product [Echinostoma caproni]